MIARLLNRTATHVLAAAVATSTARSSLCGEFGAWLPAAPGEPVSCRRCAKLARIEIAAATTLRRREVPAPQMPRRLRMRGRLRPFGIVGKVQRAEGARS